jgi:hypothetical protein
MIGLSQKGLEEMQESLWQPIQMPGNASADKADMATLGHDLQFDGGGNCSARRQCVKGQERVIRRVQ